MEKLTLTVRDKDNAEVSKKIVYHLFLADGSKITIAAENGSAASSSTIDCSRSKQFANLIDGMESLILGHAAAGIDISQEQYVAGVNSAYEKICNWF